VSLAGGTVDVGVLTDEALKQSLPSASTSKKLVELVEFVDGAGSSGPCAPAELKGRRRALTPCSKKTGRGKVGTQNFPDGCRPHRPVWRNQQGSELVASFE
jgi:hypothetical protein